jgi:hypothetical protein
MINCERKPHSFSGEGREEDQLDTCIWGGGGGKSEDNVYLDISTPLMNEHLAFMYGSSQKEKLGLKMCALNNCNKISRPITFMNRTQI